MLNLGWTYAFDLKNVMNGAAAELTGRVVATGNDCKTISHNGTNSKLVTVGMREFFLTEQGQVFEVTGIVEAANK